MSDEKFWWCVHDDTANPRHIVGPDVLSHKEMWDRLMASIEYGYQAGTHPWHFFFARAKIRILYLKNPIFGQHIKLRVSNTKCEE